MTIDSIKATADSDLWTDIIISERLFIKARQEFFTKSKDRVKILSEALNDPAQRGTALRIISFLQTEEIQELFPQLIELASVGHADIGLCRDIILALPRSWVVSNVEHTAEVFLINGSHEEYRRFLELFIKLNSGLTLRLAKRAIQNEDFDIGEAGEEFIEKLKELDDEN